MWDKGEPSLSCFACTNVQVFSNSALTVSCPMNSSTALCCPLYPTIILLYFVKSSALFLLALFTFDMKLSLGETQNKIQANDTKPSTF